MLVVEVLELRVLCDTREFLRVQLRRGLTASNAARPWSAAPTGLISPDRGLSPAICGGRLRWCGSIKKPFGEFRFVDLWTEISFETKVSEIYGPLTGSANFGLRCSPVHFGVSMPPVRFPRGSGLFVVDPRPRPRASQWPAGHGRSRACWSRWFLIALRSPSLRQLIAT